MSAGEVWAIRPFAQSSDLDLHTLPIGMNVVTGLTVDRCGQIWATLTDAAGYTDGSSSYMLAKLQLSTDLDIVPQWDVAERANFRGDASGFVMADVLSPPGQDIDLDGSDDDTEVREGSSPFSMSSTPTSPLQVEMLSCTGTSAGVELTWNLAERPMTDDVAIIERRSPPGVGSFVGVATLPLNAAVVQYAYTDVPPSEGSYSYRVTIHRPGADPRRDIDSLPSYCAATVGPGQSSASVVASIDSQVLHNLFDVTALPTCAAPYAFAAVDAGTNAVYLLGDDLQAVAGLPSQILLDSSDGRHAYGVAYAEGSDSDDLSLFVAEGGNELVGTIRKISMIGETVAGPWSLPESPANVDPRGLAYDTQTGVFAVSGGNGIDEIGCAIFTYGPVPPEPGELPALYEIDLAQLPGGEAIRGIHGVCVWDSEMTGVQIPAIGAMAGELAVTTVVDDEARLVHVTFNSPMEAAGPSATWPVASDLNPIATIPLGALPEDHTLGGIAVRTGSAVIAGLTSNRLHQVSLTATLIPVPFIRGDANGDGVTDIADAVAVLSFLFSGGSISCESSADNNDDGSLDIADAVYELSSLFSGGPPPPAPHPDCGIDPTDDTLDCVSYSSCP